MTAKMGTEKQDLVSPNQQCFRISEAAADYNRELFIGYSGALCRTESSSSAATGPHPIAHTACPVGKGRLGPSTQ